MTFQRLAILGAAAPYRTEDAIARAARRLGIVTATFDALRTTRRFGEPGATWLAWRVARFAPDFILCTRHAWRLGPRRLDRLLGGVANAFWYFDAPQRPAVLDLARSTERTFVVSQRVGAWLEAAGVGAVRQLPQAADIDLAAPRGEVDPAYHCELSFIGSGRYPHRWPILQRLAAEATMQIRGPGWGMAPSDLPVMGGEIHGPEFAGAVAGAAVSLGANALPSQDDDPSTTSNRLWQVLGVGGAFLGQWVPGADNLARDGEHCRWYQDPDDASRILAELLAEPARRQAMAARGRDYVRRYHSYDVRLGEILGIGTTV